MKIIHHVSRAARYSLFAVLVGTALALSVIRFWLLPEASRFRIELESRVGEMIGETVRIGAISARMQGIEPHVVLHDLAIMDLREGKPALSFRRVYLGISLLNSVLEGRAVVLSLRLEGARIGILRRTDGSLAVRGLNLGSAPPIWLFSLESLQLRNVDLEWQDLQADSPIVPLGRLNLKGRNDGPRHRISAGLELAGGFGNVLKMAADLQGEGGDPRDWEGKVYLEGRDLRPGGVAEMLPVATKLKSGLGQLRLWSRWRHGEMETVDGLLELNKPVIALPGDGGAGRQLSMDGVSARFGWQGRADGWRVTVNRLRWGFQGEPGSETDLIVDVAGNGENRPIVRAAMSYLRLEDLGTVKELLPEGKFREILQGLAPSGVLRNGRLVYGGEAPRRWGLCGEFADVAINPWDKFPGVDHLSGRVCGNDRGGHSAFTLREASLHSPHLWSKPVRIRTLAGDLRWSQDGAAWHIAVPALSLEGEGLRAQAAVAVDVPKAPGSTPFIDLRAHLADVDAKSLRDYLPLAAMPGNSVAWLREAFDGGQVTRADVLLFGPLAAFPFRGGEGVFQALAEVANLDLNFDPEWPHLTRLNGSVRFDGAGMLIDARSGAIGEASIRSAQAQARDFDADPWLTVAGRVDATIAQSMNFLAQTPLRHIPQRLLNVAEPRGETAIDLKLKIPLVPGLGDVAVDGVAQIKNANLSFSDLGLGLERIAGQLHFTEDALSAEGINASALGNPVRLDVGNSDNGIRVDLRGATSIADLKQTMPREFWRHAAGSFNYRLTTYIPEHSAAASDPLRLVLTSDLSGLVVRLPSPLGKAADVKRDTRVELLIQSGRKSPLRIAYGDDVRAYLWLAEPSGGFSLLGGDVAVGSAVGEASVEPGLRLRMSLPELDVSAWKAFLTGEGDANPLGAGVVRSVALDTSRLLWNGKDLGPLEMDLKREQRDWNGAMEGRFGQGHLWLQVPQYGHPVLTLDMDVLKLPKWDTKRGRPTRGEVVNPDAMPVIQLTARQTYLGGTGLGSLVLNTERWAQGLNIKSLTLQHGNHELQLRGGWMRVDGGDETRLEGKLKIDDLGLFLASLGYAKEIGDTPSEAQFSLFWPGAPHQLSSPTVRGEIDLKLGRGSILKMEPGFGRALAVLNLDSLKRLLLLDFSDMFGKGLVYDTMRGRFELGDGQARTSAFLIDAVAGRILISGRVGLVQRDLDETVTVIPHALASLPVAGAMMGGAAVGAAISMAGKLVGQDSANIASNRYAIKGSWDNPQVSRIEGNMPLDVLDRAWSGVKNLSGFGSEGEEDSNE